MHQRIRAHVDISKFFISVSIQFHSHSNRHRWKFCFFLVANWIEWTQFLFKYFEGFAAILDSEMIAIRFIGFSILYIVRFSSNQWTTRTNNYIICMYIHTTYRIMKMTLKNHIVAIRYVRIHSSLFSRNHFCSGFLVLAPLHLSDFFFQILHPLCKRYCMIETPEWTNFSLSPQSVDVRNWGDF